MTGPAYGKFLISDEVWVDVDGKFKPRSAKVYIHVRGYARAPENHIDVEVRWINNYFSPAERGKCKLLVLPFKYIYIEFSRKRKPQDLLIITGYHNFYDCLGELKSYTVKYGGKEGGMWIELPKEKMQCIDRAIEEEFSIVPKSNTRITSSRTRKSKGYKRRRARGLLEYMENSGRGRDIGGI